jgi:hypothetical protein
VIWFVAIIRRAGSEVTDSCLLGMGLTIHFKITAKLGDAKVKTAVNKMRELALDLPFKEVGEVINLKGDECDFESRRQELQGKNEPLFWLLIQAGQSVQCPWNKRISRLVNPTQIVAFNTWPGLGCEAANIGLCQYPAEIEWEYSPTDDQRFQSPYRGRCSLDSHFFDLDKWRRHCRKTFGSFCFPEDKTEQRKVPTGLDAWQWGSFCKTQYGSDSRCGGLANFLRCHISVVTLLERISKLPGIKVKINDEGK